MKLLNLKINRKLGLGALAVASGLLMSFTSTDNSEWSEISTVDGVTFYVKLSSCEDGSTYFVKAKNTNGYGVDVEYTFTQPVLPVRGPKEGSTSLSANEIKEGNCESEFSYEAILPEDQSLNISISAIITKN